MNARAIVRAGLALIVMVACIAGAAYALLRHWGARAEGANAPLDFAVPAPMLESAPQVDRARYDAEKRALISSYRVVDREGGIVRIPVDLAIDLLAADKRAPESR
ncbi:MAG: hypothetical protein ACM3SS_08920 [Rhodospirillaceae bacterium]